MEGRGLDFDDLRGHRNGGLVDSHGNHMPGTIRAGRGNGQRCSLQLPWLCGLHHSVSRAIVTLANTGIVGRGISWAIGYPPPSAHLTIGSSDHGEISPGEPGRGSMILDRSASFDAAATQRRSKSSLVGRII